MTHVLTRLMPLAVVVAVVFAGCASQRSGEPPASSPAKQAEINRLTRVIRATKGDAAAGAPLFAARCGVCHTLGTSRGRVGPDLTHYVRDEESLAFLLGVIVDPQREVHDYHTSFEITTTDGRTLIGQVLDEGTDAFVLIDPAGNRIMLTDSQVAARKPLLTSAMPEALLQGLSDRQVADLFAYLMRK